jgi:endonuclease/exonuclease/phosphatase family metal-dependent hydrolase
LKNILYKILLFVNAFFAITLLISYLAVHISPGDFALPAFFGLGYPYLLLANLILAIIWAMMLRFEGLISVVVIAIGFTHFTNYIKLIKPTSDKTNTFKVISYNVRLFNYFETPGSSNSEKRIVDFLKAQKPDILCVQEFFGLGNPDDKEAAFREALGGKYYSHIKVLGRGKNRFYGIATFSKYQIIKKGEIIHPASSSLTIYSDIVIGKDTFRVYNNHLQSFRLQKMERSFIEEMTLPENKETMNEVKGLYVSLKAGFIRRALQSQVVKDDFNDTPVSYSYRKIRNGLKDSFVNSGYGAGFTYRGNYPPNRIDYILYNNTLINSYFEIIRLKYSDHYPIVAYFKKKI